MIYPVEINSRDDMSRWYTAFKLLSMESFEPFLPEMGLDVPSSERIRTAARWFMKQYMKGTGSNEQDIQLLREVFYRIALETSNEVAQQVYEWGMQMDEFDGRLETGGKVFLWGVLFDSLARFNGNEDKVAPLALPEDKTDIVVQAAIRYEKAYHRLKPGLDQVEKSPRSDFDRWISQLYPEGCDPVDTLRAAIRFHKCSQVWQQITDSLSDDEMDALLHWGKAQAQKMNIPPELISLPF